MTLDKIVQEVLRQGQAEADRIHKEAGKKALVILDKATKDVKAMKEEAKVQANQEAEMVKRKKMSSAELESRKQILHSKAEMLETVKAQVLERMKNLPAVDREGHLRKLLAKARNIIPEGTVQFNPQDHDIVKANLGGYRMGKPADITGGIIVESLDRRKVLDLSFDMLFEETWERHIAQITHEMFGEVRV